MVQVNVRHHWQPMGSGWMPYIYILRSAYETSYDPTRTQQVPTRLNMSFISCVMMSPIQHQHIGTLMSQTHLDETTRIPVFDITDKRTL